MSQASVAHPVTIVVPVYGHLDSLTRCVDALIAHVDRSMHRVLLMNDCGPEADAIEAALLEQIAGQHGFRYERNPRNLGFVGNCNRAVLELEDTDNDILLLNSDAVVTGGFLDELIAVLHADERNGAVCARSNNATIASLPWQQRFPAPRTVERTAEVHAALRSVLPASSVSPVAMGFCLLLRRSLIRRFGLFDEAFAPGYGEENDFCLRIGRHGFRSLIAHRALVFHLGGQSFTGGRREALRSAHEKLLVSRYSDYTDAVQHYLRVDRDPADVFADCLVPADARVKVLFDLGDGEATDAAAAVLSRLSSLSVEVDVTVAVAPRARRRVARLAPGLRVLRTDAVNGVWDLAVRWPSGDPHQGHRLNLAALRESAAAELDGPLEAALLRLGRAPVDLEARRSRWTTVVSDPAYLTMPARPHEPLWTRAWRAGERRMPRPAGFVKAALRRVLGRRAG